MNRFTVSTRTITGVGARGSVVVKAQGYKPKGRGFEERWGERSLPIHLILPAVQGPGV
jgi:hypothetical protein